jgi:hypothetical protein
MLQNSSQTGEIDIRLAIQKNAAADFHSAANGDLHISQIDIAHPNSFLPPHRFVVFRLDWLLRHEQITSSRNSSQFEVALSVGGA